MFRFFLSVLLTLFICTSVMGVQTQPLPANKAFGFSTYVDPENRVVFLWTIAPGYYLYQDKLNVALTPTNGVKLSPLEFPKTKEITDLVGSRHAVYIGNLKVIAPIVGKFHGPITLTLSYQGCSVQGFCYTPIKKYFNVNETIFGKKIQAIDSLPKNTYGNVFDHHDLFFVVLSFLGLGLLLAFTPCVLPVIPILSSIILGQKVKRNGWHTFALSFTYVFGMAITYALAGVAVAMLGQNAQVILQKPSFIIVMSGLFIFLALSLFGFFDIRLPGRVQRTITELSMKQQGGTYFGVFVMGALSTLIVSPCISPPLVGVLAYIAQSGNVLIGGVALFALGFGMGIPLLLIGASAQKWLPKSGHWMDWIRKLLSLMMLGVAFWMLSRVYPEKITVLIWSVILILFFIYSLFFYQRENEDRKVFQMIGVLIGLYGILLFFNVNNGYVDTLRPWEGVHVFFTKKINRHTLPFTTIKNMQALDQALQTAQQKQTRVMLDFYAQWCSACVMIDKLVFSTSDVSKALQNYKLLRIDVTENDPFDQAVMQRFNVVAPPAIIFFDEEGRELTSKRINGEIDAPAFLKNLEE